ncbi:hypothetical protein A8926_6238 [Saccharopolyspora spinosa]|uniref:Uncharacterized protein n=1 Tax=Saccharopolyspora spinosa TaxID=60894 RepID=A0A2N3Y5F5_SACSN|nr:hypothetical protein [Saccharopolyspora spinosa]PKW18172.1 hypothetical protein A8926_6238 [Saccharopolyspora spinosa]
MANTAHLAVAGDGEAFELIIRGDELLQREPGRLLWTIRPGLAAGSAVASVRRRAVLGVSPLVGRQAGSPTMPGLTRSKPANIASTSGCEHRLTWATERS